jgi:hypothetical protein
MVHKIPAPKRSHIKIIADGSPFGVVVTDADSGRELQGVRAVRWRSEVGVMPTAELEMIFAQSDLTAHDPCIVVGTHHLTLDQWRRVETFIREIAPAKE